MRSKMMTVNPQIAQIFLKKMVRNRSVRKASVQTFACDMLEGRWLPTHQGIAFDEDGRLIDGQHRLLAVIEAGVSVRMMVVEGVESSAMTAIDVGRARDCRDAAVISGATSVPRHGTWTRSIIASLFHGHPSPAKVAEAVRPLRPHLDAISDVFSSLNRVRAGVAGAFVVAHASHGVEITAMARRVYTNDALAAGTGLWWCRRRIDEVSGGGEIVVYQDARRVLRAIEIELRGTPVKCFRGEPDLDKWRQALPQEFRALFESA